jgi:hypothetical protein
MNADDETVSARRWPRTASRFERTRPPSADDHDVAGLDRRRPQTYVM